MTGFVLDASVAASWAFEGGRYPAADSAFEKARFDEIAIPAIWWYEIRNALIVNERRNRLVEADTLRFLRDLNHLRIRLDSEPEEAEVLRIARKHRLTVYDSAYLELAKRRRFRLATLDEHLARAAVAENVELLR